MRSPGNLKWVATLDDGGFQPSEERYYSVFEAFELLVQRRSGGGGPEIYL